MPVIELSPETQYMLMVVGLFLVPRILQRFRMPTAVTCLGLGAAMGMGFGLFQGDKTLVLLATLGIASMFLFAGLEVDFDELKKSWQVVLGHLTIQSLLLGGAAFAGRELFGLEIQAAVLFALALLTPSAGFILDSLGGLGLDKDQRFWVKAKAISSELLALIVLFVTVQSSDAVTLGVSSLALVAMIAILPVLFRVFAKRILPFAPKSEFTFLVIAALICALITRRLGVYYLVGAFVVGVTAVRLRKRMPAMASEQLLSAVELFASFFIPFYFFKAGLGLRAEYFTLDSLILGFAFVAVVVPLRILLVAVHRRFSRLKDRFGQGTRVGLTLVPTLVFTMVIAGILQERYALAPHLYGALLVFTLVNTLLPGFILKAAVPDFHTLEAPPVVPEEALELIEAEHAGPPPLPLESSEHTKSAAQTENDFVISVEGASEPA